MYVHYLEAKEVTMTQLNFGKICLLTQLTVLSKKEALKAYLMTFKDSMTDIDRKMCIDYGN